MAEDKTAVHTIKDLLGTEHHRQSAYLIFISAKSTELVGKMVKLERSEVSIGRADEATLQVEDDGVSRKHCKIAMSGNGQFQLIDLGSTNGTFLNGSKVNIGPLQDGDKVQVGANTVLKFCLQDKLDEAYQRSIYESATRDGLTRLFNKKYFMDTLRKEFAYCQRHRVPLSVVLADVDFFKKVNDTYGHPAGDFVLQRVADRIGETIRQEDLFARIGGEEFALMLRESPADKALRCAERCRQAVESQSFVFGGVSIRATISLGVATLGDGEHLEMEELVASADRYLYLAKQTGRNRVKAKDEKTVAL